MKKNKVVKNPWFAGILLFQALPVALLLWNLQAQNQQTSDAGWMNSTDGICQVFTNYNFQNRSFNWSGNCVDGFADGYGELEILENGRKILRAEGGLTKGKLEGEASLQFLVDGDLYEGSFYMMKSNVNRDNTDHTEEIRPRTS